VQRSPGDANGSRECAPDDRLRIVWVTMHRVAGAQGPVARALNHVQTDAFNRQNRTIGIFRD
jgi:hypothetical protein